MTRARSPGNLTSSLQGPLVIGKIETVPALAGDVVEVTLRALHLFGRFLE